MSDGRGRLNRLEREAAVAAVRNGAQANVFDVLLSVILGEVALDEVNPDDRPLVERLYNATVRGEPAPASPLDRSSDLAPEEEPEGVCQPDN
jgi:hypothetical protein